MAEIFTQKTEMWGGGETGASTLEILKYKKGFQKLVISHSSAIFFYQKLIE
jgi:hypothetical protein